MGHGVGDIVDGRVTGITKFGAFVSLGEGKTGLVHISEVAHSYVKDIREYLTEGQEVRVKITGIDPAGRINLSIKKALPPPERPAAPAPRASGYHRPAAPEADNFEDKLKSFLQDSNNRMSDIKHQIDRKSGASRRPRPR